MQTCRGLVLVYVEQYRLTMDNPFGFLPLSHSARAFLFGGWIHPVTATQCRTLNLKDCIGDQTKTDGRTKEIRNLA